MEYLNQLWFKKIFMKQKIHKRNLIKKVLGLAECLECSYRKQNWRSQATLMKKKTKSWKGSKF